MGRMVEAGIQSIPEVSTASLALGQQAVATTDVLTEDELHAAIREEYNRVVPNDDYVRTFVYPFDQYLSENRDSIERRRRLRHARRLKFLREMECC